MVKNQVTLNQKLFDDWATRGLKWDTAIVVEAAELIDHLAWKWWKKGGKSDVAQAQMEVIDILHFLLSHIAQRGDAYAAEVMEASAVFFDSVVTPPDEIDNEAAIFKTKRLLESLLSGRSCPALMSGFGQLAASLGLSFNDVYKLYISKGVLNQFRWENGYGTTYIKDWFGWEDNEYLTELLTKLDVNDPDFVKHLQTNLKSQYAEVVKAAEEKAA